MYDVKIEVESLVYIYVYVGSRTIFFPVMLSRRSGIKNIHLCSMNIIVVLLHSRW